MPNTQRGEFTITAGEQTFTLVLDTNALALLDDAEPKGAWDVLGRAAEGRPSAIRKFMWAALQKHHAATVKTYADAGTVIDTAGGMLSVARQLGALQASATPDAADLEELGVETRPPKARAARRRGTGEGSTFAPAKSA